MSLGYPVFTEPKDDGGGGDNWSYKSRKAPVKSSPPKKQHPVFYRPDALPVAQPTVSNHWRENHIPWTCLPQAHLWVFQLCLWPLIAPGYLGRGLLPFFRFISPLMTVPLSLAQTLTWKFSQQLLCSVFFKQILIIFHRNTVFFIERNVCNA